MKNKALLLTIFLGIMGLVSFTAEAESRMVCLPESETRTAQDQGPLACRYHWAKTVFDSAKSKKLYRCYIQFKEDGVKLVDMPTIVQKISIEAKDQNEDAPQSRLKANAAKSDAIKNFLLTTNSLPAQAMLATTQDKNGDDALTTGKGSRPLYIQFTDPYPQEKYDILKKANYGISTIDELSKVVTHHIQFESWRNFVPHIQDLLPCLGCVDLDGECKKK